MDLLETKDRLKDIPREFRYYLKAFRKEELELLLKTR